LGWHKITKQEINIVKGMLSNCLVIQLIPFIKDTAIDLKQKYKIKLPDAVIAATAIHLNVPLLTADKSIAQVKEADILLVEM
jgi:predicted nucleic acid-binding protein